MTRTYMLNDRWILVSSTSYIPVELGKRKDLQRGRIDYLTGREWVSWEIATPERYTRQETYVEKFRDDGEEWVNVVLNERYYEGNV